MVLRKAPRCPEWLDIDNSISVDSPKTIGKNIQTPRGLESRTTRLGPRITAVTTLPNEHSVLKPNQSLVYPLADTTDYRTLPSYTGFADPRGHISMSKRNKDDLIGNDYQSLSTGRYIKNDSHELGEKSKVALDLLRETVEMHQLLFETSAVSGYDDILAHKAKAVSIKALDELEKIRKAYQTYYTRTERIEQEFSVRQQEPSLQCRGGDTDRLQFNESLIEDLRTRNQKPFRDTSSSYDRMVTSREEDVREKLKELRKNLTSLYPVMSPMKLDMDITSDLSNKKADLSLLTRPNDEVSLSKKSKHLNWKKPRETKSISDEERYLRLKGKIGTIGTKSNS